MASLRQEPEEYGYYGNYLADPSVRLAIHVGNLTYNDGTPVEKHLLNDIMASVKPWIAVLLDNYKVGKCHALFLIAFLSNPVSLSSTTTRWGNRALSSFFVHFCQTLDRCSPRQLQGGEMSWVFFLLHFSIL